MGGVVINRPAIRILGGGGAALSLTGTLTETVLATVIVPAGSMGLNGILRVTTYWSNNNSANNKNARVRFGASGAGTGGTLFSVITQTTNTNWKLHTHIANRNSVSSQIGDTGNGTGGWSPSTTTWATSSIATSSASEVAICGQLANVADTLTLEHYLVELIVP